MPAQTTVPTKATSPGRVKWIIVTVVVGLLLFLAGPNAPLGGFWGAPQGGPALSSPQAGLFILLSAIESLATGFGVAFVVFGWSLIDSLAPGRRGLARATHLAIAWLLVNWWPHSSFHQVVGDSIGGLLAIDYAFHVPLMLAGIVVSYYFVTMVRAKAT